MYHVVGCHITHECMHQLLHGEMINIKVCLSARMFLCYTLQIIELYTKVLAKKYSAKVLNVGMDVAILTIL